MRCQVCRTEGRQEGDLCPFCGAIVRSVLGKGPPLPSEVAREFEDSRRERESAQADTRRAQYRRHAIAGALLFCALGCLIFLVQLAPSLGAGMTGKVSGGSFVLRLVLSFVLIPVYAALLGAPMGLLVSWQRLSFAASGFLGALSFMAAYFLLGMRFMFGPVEMPVVTISSVAVFGYVFGAALSVHVRVSSQN
jgi:hypothetical protein